MTNPRHVTDEDAQIILRSTGRIGMFAKGLTDTAIHSMKVDHVVKTGGWPPERANRLISYMEVHGATFIMTPDGSTSVKWGGVA